MSFLNWFTDHPITAILLCIMVVCTLHCLEGLLVNTIRAFHTKEKEDHDEKDAIA